MSRKSLENDMQVKHIRSEIQIYATRIGVLKSMDERQEHVKGTIEFLELMVKMRKEALDKLGLSYNLPEGQRLLVAGH